MLEKIITVLLVASTSFMNFRYFDNTDKEVFEKIEKSTVYVDTYYSSCTGIVLSNSGLYGSTILTCKHCVEDSTWIEIDEEVPYKVDLSEDYDLAILHAPYIQGKEELELNPVVTTEDDLYCVGIIDGMKRRRKGKLKGVAGEDLYFDFSVIHGNSGSGVFNQDGEVIGIVSSVLCYGIFVEIEEKDETRKPSESR